MRNKRSYFISVLLVLFCMQSFATTYYSRTTGGNWNVNSTWSTVNYGNATNTGTYPKVGDIANIGDGYTIYINTTVNCANVNVGQGRSGILRFTSGANYILNVSGNISVARSARFDYNTAALATHTVQVSGNFNNNGIVDFYVAAGELVNLIFNGNSNSTVSGTGTWDLNDVSLIKSTSTNNYLSANIFSFEAAIRNFVGTYGTYIHNNAGSYSINPTAVNYTIGPNVKFKVPMGTMWFSSAANNLILQGALYVDGGIATVGSTQGLGGLSSDQSGATVPYLEVTAGTLNVYGGISYWGGSALDPFSFMMTGGTININTGTTGSNTHLFCVNDVANSSFNMSGGTIILQKVNTLGYNNFDVGICGTNGTVNTTGGTIQYGNASTPSGFYFSFVPLPNAVYPNFYVTGPAANIVTVGTSVNATANFKLLSLNIDPNKGFDIRSVAGTAGDTKTMTLTGTIPASTDAFRNNGTFYQRFSNVVFNGNTAQAVSGSTTTTLYYLSINNAADVTLNKPVNLSSHLYLTNGKLITTNTNILTCAANANCDLGSASTFVEGPLVHTVSTSVLISKIYPFGKNGIHRPVVLTVKHATSASVTYRAEVFNTSASALPFTLPANISRVSQMRYVKFIRSAVANFSSGGVQMYYGTDDVVWDYTTLQVAQDDGISAWRSLGGTASSNGSGNIISSTFTTFTNYFALANPPGGNNPLPVSLTKFFAKQNNNTVEVNWRTATEANCDHFTVERSSNNRDFAPIAVVNGAGNSVENHYYNIVDENPLTRVSYYRLKQTDYNGTEQVYPVVSVRFGAITGGRNNFVAYPTVSDGSDIHLANSGEDMSTYSIAVHNMNGNVIPATIKPNGDGISLSINEQSAYRDGVYLITATRGNEILKDKVIISKNN